MSKRPAPARTVTDDHDDEPRRLDPKPSKLRDFRIALKDEGLEYHFGVGVAVLACSDERPGQVLLGKRKGSDGSGTWALPGGHLEFGEEPWQAGVRELLEETGLRVSMECPDAGRGASPNSCELLGWENAVGLDARYHYVTAFVRCNIESGQLPENKEPEKCEGWSWHDWDGEAGKASSFPPDEELFLALALVRQKGILHPFRKSHELRER